MPFKTGDVVRLKSGGPPMTVTGMSQTGSVICQWFWNNKMESGSFPPDALELDA
jgi:uncharacterized protein YodC (DUF2158 family)